MKFKSIEIEAFRGYNELQVFDFTKDQEIMDLIVICAPNGFGKTSFFDAIEWGYSGSIKRISGNNRVKEIANYDKGNILKNKNSKKNFGTIKYTLDNGESIILNTPELDGRRKQDYGEPIIQKTNEFFFEERNLSFINQNLLTHDKIDSFLRFSTFTERFDALKEFWDHSNETLIYSNLVQMYKITQNSKEDIDDKISSVQEEMNAIKPSNEMINHINILIANIFNDEIERDSNFKDFILDYNNLVQKLSQKLSLYETKESQIFINIEKAKNLELRFYSDYNNNTKLLSNNDMEKQELIRLTDKFNLWNIKKEEIRNKKELISELSSKIMKYDSLFNKYDFYESSNQRIDLKKNQIRDINNDIRSTNETIFGLDNHLVEINKEQLIMNSKKENLTNDLLLLKECNEKRDSFNKKKFYENRIDRIKKYLIEIRKQIIHNELLINTYKDNILADTKSLMSKVLIEHPTDSTKKIYESCRYYYSQNLQLYKLIDEKKKLYVKYDGLNDNLRKLNELGTTLIVEANLTSCPLCHQQFNDFNELLNKINNNTRDILEIDGITYEISLLENKINQNEAELINYREAYNQALNEAVNEAQEKYTRYYKAELKLNNWLDSCNSLIEQHQLNINYIYNFLSNNSIAGITEIGELDLNLNLLYTKISENIESINIELVRNKNNIDQTTNEINTNKSVLDKLKVKMDLINRQISECLNHQDYVEIKPLVEELLIKDNINSKEQLSKVIDKLKSSLSQENLSLNEIIKSSDQIAHELEDRNYDNLINQINQLDGLNYELIKIRDQFTTDYVILIGCEDVSLHQLQLFVSEEDEKLNKIRNQTQLSKELLNNIEVLKQSELWEVKNNNLKELQYEEKQIINLLSQINELVKMSKEHIESQIASKFNLDIINKLYQMVEPHPDFINIEFKIVELDDYQLGLKISASNREKTKEESPILYFSSAQVNILSLSIFLAKALESNNGYNTIFMDDPIQHLDSINLLSFIDLLRIITTSLDKQIIISTHDDRFFNLIKRKLDSNYFKSKFIKLESVGKTMK